MAKDEEDGAEDEEVVEVGRVEDGGLVGPAEPNDGVRLGMATAAE